MRKDLGLHAFKIKLTQELKPLDHLKHRSFSNWALAKLEENEEFHRKIIFSGEVNFWLNGFVKGPPYPELSKNRIFFFFVSIDGTIIREYCRKILQSISE